MHMRDIFIKVKAKCYRAIGGNYDPSKQRPFIKPSSNVQLTPHT